MASMELQFYFVPVSKAKNDVQPKPEMTFALAHCSDAAARMGEPAVGVVLLPPEVVQSLLPGVQRGRHQRVHHVLHVAHRHHEPQQVSDDEYA